MYKTLNKIIDVCLRSIYDVAKFMGELLLIFFIEGANLSHFYLSEVYFIAIIQYIGIYFLLLLIIGKHNKKFKTIYSVITIILSFIVPLVVSNIYSSFLKVFLAAFFSLITTKAILYSQFEIEPFEDLEKEKRTLLLWVYMFFIFGMFFIHNKGVIVQAAKADFIIILISKLICISRFSFLEEYALGCSIKIGKDKNLFRMNLISIFTIFITVLIASLREVKFVIKVMYDGFAELYSLVGFRIISALSNTFLRRIFVEYAKKRNELRYKKNDELNDINELRKKLYEEQMAQHANKSINTTIATTIAIILIIIAIILVIYYVSKRIKINIIKDNISDEQIETKEFIFRDKNQRKFKDIYNLINENRLNKIRKLYIKLVYDLRKKGVNYKRSFTPIEYCKAIDESGHGNEYAKYIIQLYNKNRYGNKTINKDELDKVYKLKNIGKM